MDHSPSFGLAGAWIPLAPFSSFSGEEGGSEAIGAFFSQERSGDGSDTAPTFLL
ncbi:hypothetical protein HRbin22_02441 [Candidatus Thermoflexus japonica]|uniref:Uncharacterized protein n=1 Tax=Candidatus Thermoflexus japonica TaxID=2035417 RepID=A0A2H5Y9N7_9CHLR|nr:hypothetical protein HRbin22_02441 [Candidatus Thermoflexus japonica]